METRNRKRRRPSVKLHQHSSQNLPGTSQQPRQLPSTQMPDQLPPNQQPVQLPPNQQPVQLPLTPSHRLGQWSSNQQSGHQPDQLPLSQQLGDQMQPAASQPDPAVQSGNGFSEDIFLPGMIPSFQSVLGDHVPQSIKVKIISGQYVDLACLLEAPVVPEDLGKHLVLNNSGELVVKPNMKQSIVDIAKWTDAFLIFSSIYLSAHPVKMQDLLKYMHTIRLGAARHTEGWRSYDQQFRLRMGNNPANSWAMIDMELWLLCMGPPRQPVHDTGNFVRKCYDFNYTRCLRSVCNYKHACMICGSDHPSRVCHLKPRNTSSLGGGSVRGAVTQTSYRPRAYTFRPRGPIQGLRGPFSRY